MPSYCHTTVRRKVGRKPDGLNFSLLNLFSHRKIAGVATLGSLKAKVLKGNVLRNDSVIKARTTISYWTKQFTKNMKVFKRFNFQIPVIKYAYGYFCSFGSQTLSKFTELKLLTN